MIEQIKLLFTTFKFYLLAILIAALSTAWLVDRHAQYNAGIAYCAQQQADAQAKYSQGKEAQNEKEKQQAIERADNAANQINTLKHEKELLLKNLDSKCVLSDSERMRFNEALDRLQGQ